MFVDRFSVKGFGRKNKVVQPHAIYLSDRAQNNGNCDFLAR
jgi:hypothetical protein